jgi:hypothetical protein
MGGGMGGMGGGMSGGGPPRPGASAPVAKPEVITQPVRCSLEELFHGATKKLKITKKILDPVGRVTSATNVHEIVVKPGWKVERRGARDLSLHFRLLPPPLLLLCRSRWLPSHGPGRCAPLWSGRDQGDLCWRSKYRCRGGWMGSHEC